MSSHFCLSSWSNASWSLPSITKTNSPLGSSASYFSLASFRVVKNDSSYFLVSSLFMLTLLFPSAFSNSASVLASLCGASYIIIVLVSFCNCFRTFSFFFLSFGKNASKQNLCVESPDIEIAVTQALAPGKEVTSIPFSRHSFTSSSPGSEMPGVPASVISAMSFPSNIICTNSLALSYLLNSW